MLLLEKTKSVVWWEGSTQQGCTNPHVKSYRSKLRYLLGRLVDTKESEVAKGLLFTQMGKLRQKQTNPAKVAKQVNGQE